MTEAVRKILRPKEVARRLGCSDRYVAILIDSGKLRGFKLAGSTHRRVYEDVLEQFIRERYPKEAGR